MRVPLGAQVQAMGEAGIGKPQSPGEFALHVAVLLELGFDPVLPVGDIQVRLPVLAAGELSAFCGGW